MRVFQVAVVVLLVCSGCGQAGDDNVEPSPLGDATSDASTAGNAIERQLAADAFSLNQALYQSSTGDFLPARTVGREVTIGDQTILLSLADASFRVYEIGNKQCVDVSAPVGGIEIVSSHTASTGTAGESELGLSCLQVHPDATEVEVPTKNYPGLIGWNEIIPDTGTCIDLRYLVLAEDDFFELPFVVDCSGPHEYVIIEVPPLDLGDAPSDEEIEEASRELCLQGVDDWIASSGSDPLSYGWWSPWDWAYQQGDRTVQCLAQMDDDVEVWVTYEEAYGD